MLHTLTHTQKNTCLTNLSACYQALQGPSQSSTRNKKERKKERKKKAKENVTNSSSHASQMKTLSNNLKRVDFQRHTDDMLDSHSAQLTDFTLLVVVAMGEAVIRK